MTVDQDGDLEAYPLQRQLFSNVRLYIQHWMWRRELGYILHPRVSIDKGTKIVDIACGNCAWLIDAAREYPQAQFDGFDISPAQFPHSGWMPKSIRLSTMDIFKPIPDELRGKYDVVHVGLLVFVVDKDDPVPILDNLLALLKPGGYLQWDEADYAGSHVKIPESRVPHAALQELKDNLQNLLKATKESNFEWVRKLGPMFKQRGLNVLDDTFKSIPDDIAQPWTLQHMLAAAEVINVIHQKTGKGTDWWKLYDRAVAEVEQGASVRMGMVSVVGQKPR